MVVTFGCYNHFSYICTMEKHYPLHVTNSKEYIEKKIQETTGRALELRNEDIQDQNIVGE